MCQVLYLYFGCGHSDIKYNDCNPRYTGTTFLRIACPNYEPHTRHVPGLKCGKQPTYCSKGPYGQELDAAVVTLQAQTEALRQQEQTLNASVNTLRQYRDSACHKGATIQALVRDGTYRKLTEQVQKHHEDRENLSISVLNIRHEIHNLMVHLPGFQQFPQPIPNQPALVGLNAQQMQPQIPLQQPAPARPPVPAMNEQPANLFTAAAQSRLQMAPSQTPDPETPVPKRRKGAHRPDPVAAPSYIKETPEPSNLRRSTRARNTNVKYAASDVSSPESREVSPDKSDAAWDSEAFESSGSPVKGKRQSRSRGAATGQHATNSSLPAHPRSTLGSIITDYQKRARPANKQTSSHAGGMFPDQQRRYPRGPSSAKSDIKPSLDTPFVTPTAGYREGYQSSGELDTPAPVAQQETQIPRKRRREPDFITPAQYADVNARDFAVPRAPRPMFTVDPRASAMQFQGQSGVHSQGLRSRSNNNAGSTAPMMVSMQQPAYPFQFRAPVQPQNMMGSNAQFPMGPKATQMRGRSLDPAPVLVAAGTQQVHRSSSFGNPMPVAALMQAARERGVRRSASRATMPPPPLPANASMPVLTSAFHPPTTNQPTAPSYGQLQRGFDTAVDLTPQTVFDQPPPPPSMEPVKRRRSVTSPSIGQRKRLRLSLPGEDDAPIMRARRPEMELPTQTQADEQAFDFGPEQMLPSQSYYGTDPAALPECPLQQMSMDARAQDMPLRMQPTGQVTHVAPSDLFTNTSSYLPPARTASTSAPHIAQPSPQHDYRANIAGLEAASSDPALPDIEEAAEGTNEGSYTLPSDPATEIEWAWDDQEGHGVDFSGMFGAL